MELQQTGPYLEKVDHLMYGTPDLEATIDDLEMGFGLLADGKVLGFLDQSIDHSA